VAERICKGAINSIIAWVKNHVFFYIRVRWQQQRGKRAHGGCGNLGCTRGPSLILVAIKHGQDDKKYSVEARIRVSFAWGEACLIRNE
jgi:hypothetical protein